MRRRTDARVVPASARLHGSISPAPGIPQTSPSRRKPRLLAAVTLAGDGAAAMRTPCNRRAPNGNDGVISTIYRDAEIDNFDVRFRRTWAFVKQ